MFPKKPDRMSEEELRDKFLAFLAQGQRKHAESAASIVLYLIAVGLVVSGLMTGDFSGWILGLLLASFIIRA